ncbi:MAG: substrate-binding domain-containing protein, partial [Desulfobacteraceae bacterium]|nr:substrate-binding domain-containing protein [Desulfobacteraceae bacterium]
MWKKSFSLVFLILLFGFFMAFLFGCEKKDQELIVYSGQGLKNVMNELIADFENKHNLRVKVIYAGSETLLEAIVKSKRGDVFIPGSDKFIDKAGDLVLSH